MGILLDNFQNKLKNLTESELTAFNTLDNQIELLTESTLTVLAQKLYISNTTLIRLSQKLGFSGFTTFKNEIQQLVKPTKFDSKISFGFKYYQTFFNESPLQHNSSKLDIFADEIFKATTIFIIGQGLTKPIAEYMSKYLYQLDRSSIYISENHMIESLPNLIHKNDLVIFLSSSGQTSKLIQCASKVSQKGAILLSITNSTHCDLNYHCKYSLTSGVEENYYHNNDITSRTVIMVLVDLILNIYLNRYLQD